MQSPSESVTQTNQRAVIFCPHPRRLLRQAAGGGGGGGGWALFSVSTPVAVEHVEMLEGDDAAPALRWPSDFPSTRMHTATIMAIVSDWLDMGCCFLVCLVIS